MRATLRGFSVNVNVIAEMQNKKEKNHCMCLKSRSLYHFSASKGKHLSGECAGIFKWQPLKDTSYNSGKEVEFTINP